MKLRIFEVKGTAPECDEGSCPDCGWTGLLDGLKTSQDYESWEMPTLYTIHHCPKCDEPVEYEMSEQRSKEWLEWNERNKK